MTGKILQKQWLSILVSIAAVIMVLNYHGRGMQGILPWYLNIKHIILAGFNTKVAIASPTFPMWGYSWLLMLSENKLVILTIQNAFGLFMLGGFLRHIDAPLPTKINITLCLIPFFACNSLMWPYALTASLLMGTALLLLYAFNDEKFNAIELIASGGMMGLSLNFRSDHILLPFIIAGVIIIFHGFKVYKKVAVWLATIALCMVPWMVYTKHVSGRTMLTSSNGGAVMFLGLGTIPNPWGITPFDDDPLLNKIIEERFGGDELLLSPRTDDYLKSEFISRIKQLPILYVKKCLISFGRTMIDGPYRGEFYEVPNCQPGCEDYYKAQKKELKSNPWNYIRTNPGYFSRIVLQILSGLVGRTVVLVSFILLPITLTRKDFMLALFGTFILYQAMIDALIFHKSSSTSMVYFFHMINAFAGISILWEWGIDAI